MFCLFIDKTKKQGNISKQVSKTCYPKLENLSHITGIYSNSFLMASSLFWDTVSICSILPSGELIAPKALKTDYILNFNNF